MAMQQPTLSWTDKAPGVSGRTFSAATWPSQLGPIHIHVDATGSDYSTATLASSSSLCWSSPALSSSSCASSKYTYDAPADALSPTEPHIHATKSLEDTPCPVDEIIFPDSLDDACSPAGALFVEYHKQRRALARAKAMVQAARAAAVELQQKQAVETEALRAAAVELLQQKDALVALLQAELAEQRAQYDNLLAVASADRQRAANIAVAVNETLQASGEAGCCAAEEGAIMAKALHLRCAAAGHSTAEELAAGFAAKTVRVKVLQPPTRPGDAVVLKVEDPLVASRAEAALNNTLPLPAGSGASVVAAARYARPTSSATAASTSSLSHTSTSTSTSSPRPCCSSCCSSSSAGASTSGRSASQSQRRRQQQRPARHVAVKIVPFCTPAAAALACTAGIHPNSIKMLGDVMPEAVNMLALTDSDVPVASLLDMCVRPCSQAGAVRDAGCDRELVMVMEYCAKGDLHQHVHAELDAKAAQLITVPALEPSSSCPAVAKAAKAARAKAEAANAATLCAMRSCVEEAAMELLAVVVPAHEAGLLLDDTKEKNIGVDEHNALKHFDLAALRPMTQTMATADAWTSQLQQELLQAAGDRAAVPGWELEVRVAPGHGRLMTAGYDAPERDCSGMSGRKDAAFSCAASDIYSVGQALRALLRHANELVTAAGLDQAAVFPRGPLDELIDWCTAWDFRMRPDAQQAADWLATEVRARDTPC